MRRRADVPQGDVAILVGRGQLRRHEGAQVQAGHRPRHRPVADAAGRRDVPDADGGVPGAAHQREGEAGRGTELQAGHDLRVALQRELGHDAGAARRRPLGARSGRLGLREQGAVCVPEVDVQVPAPAGDLRAVFLEGHGLHALQAARSAECRHSPGGRLGRAATGGVAVLQGAAPQRAVLAPRDEVAALPAVHREGGHARELLGRQPHHEPRLRALVQPDGPVADGRGEEAARPGLDRRDGGDPVRDFVHLRLLRLAQRQDILQGQGLLGGELVELEVRHDVHAQELPVDEEVEGHGLL
mmetsp:Transcript_78494/g.230227  ORF Transcript_78494/g.230227 Transcript_78494/m.230227 type:complete len:300 (-) Transcript_78494:265-1164(-)